MKPIVSCWLHPVITSGEFQTPVLISKTIGGPGSPLDRWVGTDMTGPEEPARSCQVPPAPLAAPTACLATWSAAKGEEGVLGFVFLLAVHL